MKMSIPRSQVEKKNRWRRRIKKHSRTSPDVQFKEFSWTKQKEDLEPTMREL